MFEWSTQNHKILSLVQQWLNNIIKTPGKQCW